MTGRKFKSGHEKRKRKFEEEKFLATQKNSILRYLKPLSDANTQENATDVVDRLHPGINPHLEDSQPQDDLDNLPVPEDDPDPLPHEENNPGLVQLEENDNGTNDPQPKDDQLPIDVSENNLVEENKFLSTSQ